MGQKYSGTSRVLVLGRTASYPIVLILNTKVVQSSTILLLYSYADSPSLEASFTIRALYIVLGTRLSSAKYPRRASLLFLVIPYRR